MAIHVATDYSTRQCGGQRGRESETIGGHRPSFLFRDILSWFLSAIYWLSQADLRYFLIVGRIEVTFAAGSIKRNFSEVEGLFFELVISVDHVTIILVFLENANVKTVSLSMTNSDGAFTLFQTSFVPSISPLLSSLSNPIRSASIPNQRPRISYQKRMYRKGYTRIILLT